MYTVAVSTKDTAPINLLANIRAANPTVLSTAQIASVTITSITRAITGNVEAVTESSIHVTAEADTLKVEHGLSIPVGKWSVVTLVGVLNYLTGVFHFASPEVVGITFNVVLK